MNEGKPALTLRPEAGLWKKVPPSTCQLKFTKAGTENVVLFSFSTRDTYNDILGDVSRQTLLLVSPILPNKAASDASCSRMT